MMDYDFDYEELLRLAQHEQRLHRKLMRLEPGHPDEGALLDALEENKDE